MLFCVFLTQSLKISTASLIDRISINFRKPGLLSFRDSLSRPGQKLLTRKVSLFIDCFSVKFSLGPERYPDEVSNTLPSLGVGHFLTSSVGWSFPIQGSPHTPFANVCIQAPYKEIYYLFISVISLPFFPSYLLPFGLMS